MAEQIGSKGLIRIKSESDRIAVSTILFKNGYTVRPVKVKKNGTSYEYYVEYTTRSMAPDETEDAE